MKTPLIAAFLVAVSATVAAPAFAGGSTVTRSQVRAELAALQQAGYLPNRPNDPNYPDNLQAALRRVHETDAVAVESQASGYGSDAEGATQSGSHGAVRPAGRSIYFGH